MSGRVAMAATATSDFGAVLPADLLEVYIPDLPKQSYQNLLAAFDQEFTYSFGGCTIIGALFEPPRSGSDEKVRLD